MSDTRIKLNPYQEGFILSQKRYPAMISAIGTGKTMMMLSKLWRLCEKYPDSLVLIVRKEFTDLRDSTIKDFTFYFGVGINAEKDYNFPNGSCMMFRHGSELAVLKNVNLTAFGIEQAEEFETDTEFTFLRDRLRRKNAPLRQGVVIANANGHNWIWNLWVYNPGKSYDPFQANTFDNAHNLPDDFIEDLREMEHEAPNHYKRFVMNNHDVAEGDDYILNSDDLAISLGLTQLGSPGGAILSLDVARFGSDLNVATLLEARGTHRFEETLAKDWGGLDLMVTTGKTVDLIHTTKPEVVVVDGDGLGAGIVDRLRELKIPVVEFRGGKKARSKDKFFNRRSEGALEVADLIKRSWLKILDEETIKNELLSIKYTFDSRGRKRLEPKDKIKERLGKSPNFFDSLMMGVYYRRRISVGLKQNVSRLPRRAKGFMSSFFNEGRRAMRGGG